jgi:voltage-gated potassium channel
MEIISALAGTSFEGEPRLNRNQSEVRRGTLALRQTGWAMATGLRAGLQRLYFGSSRTAQTFQFASIIFEIGLMAYFIGSSFLPHRGWIIRLDLGIAAILLADFLIRWWITERPSTYFRRISTWADLIVIITMVLPALFGQNLLFLRAVRAIRIFRSYHLLQELYEHYAFIRTNRDAIEASVNLIVFVFVMSALVYVLEVGRHPNITNFIDALYFTVSTLSTTGFGDITFPDPYGRLLSIFIMIVGVGLFLRLLQVIFRPPKVRHECPTCGLTRHEPDAVHCKHCGRILHIETEGGDG